MFGQCVGAQRHAGDDAKGAAAAAAQGPEQVRVAARICDPDDAVRGDDLGFQQARCGGAVVLRVAAEAAALHQSRDADVPAAATLDIAATSGHHLIVDMHPDRAGADGDGRLRRIQAALRDEAVVQRDVAHRAGPDHQRVGCTRCAEIRVAAAPDDQPKIVVTGEIDGGNDVTCLARRDSVGTWLGRPCIEIARSLGQRRVVADVVGVLQPLEHVAARRT